MTPLPLDNVALCLAWRDLDDDNLFVQIKHRPRAFVGQQQQQQNDIKTVLYCLLRGVFGGLLCGVNWVGYSGDDQWDHWVGGHCGLTILFGHFG